MKHKQEKYPTTFGPEDSLPAYGIPGMLRHTFTKHGRAHLAAITTEGVRRYEDRRATEAHRAAMTAEPEPTAQPETPRSHRKASGPVVNRAKVVANYAISGERTSPFEDVEPKRAISDRARKVRRAVGAVAAAAVGVAGISAAAVFTARAISSSEASHARTHATQQAELGKVVDPHLATIGKAVYRAYTDWEAKHPGDATAYTEKSLPGNRIDITANTSSNEVVMETKLVDGKRVADPAHTIYAYVETEGNGTIANQYFLGAPGGSEYLPSDITTWPVGSGDYFESASAPGLDGVMSVEDTTAYNDAIEGTDFSSPAALAQDINSTYGLDNVLDHWQHDPQAVNSTANPDQY